MQHHASKYAVTPSITLQHLASRIKLCCDKSPNNPIIRVALPTIIDHQLLEMRGMPGLLRAEICFYNPGYWNTELYFCNIHFFQTFSNCIFNCIFQMYLSNVSATGKVRIIRNCGHTYLYKLPHLF